MISSFKMLAKEQEPLAGGKGRTLARLYQAGYRVPDGFIILPAAFVGDELTGEAWIEVQVHLVRMRRDARDGSFAVRSSALSEDSAQASFAGEFETVLDVQTDEDIREAIHTVRRSRHNTRVQAYSQAQGLEETEHEIAIVVQCLIQADFSGVLFTADPVTGDLMRMTGNFVQGLGEKLVSGQANPQTFVIRAFALRAGELTGVGEDVFFLTMDEVLALLSGDDAARRFLPIRKDTYERYRALPPYPTIIVGRFDPFQWAADPNRRSDIYNANAPTAPHGADTAGTIKGFAGALGIIEGTVRRLDRLEDSDQLRPGEILVTTLTNIGWTPLFPRTAAIITDLGAPLSHAAIVARELGIPAVVGCGDATMRLKTGDRVRVDGGKGLVEILESI